MKYIAILFCGLAPLWASSQISYHIKGILPNWKANSQDSVFISYLKDNTRVTDSTAVVDGRYEFKGTADQAYLMYIWCQPLPKKERRDGTTLYLESGTTTITAKDSLRHAVIMGGMVNRDYQENKKREEPITRRMGQLMTQTYGIKKEDLKSESTIALNTEYQMLVDSLISVRKRFILTYPDHFMALEALNSIMPPQFSYAKFAPLYNKLDVSLHNTPLGKVIAAKLEKAKHIDIGSIMPEFSSLDTSRKNINLSNVIKSGRLTLVDFWASWCKPCRAENPNVVKAFNAFHDKGLNIISVSLDKNEVNWKNAILQDGMPWYHVSGLQYWEEPVALLFGINAVPDNFLLDAKGKVLARGLKGEALYKMIEGQLQ